MTAQELLNIALDLLNIRGSDGVLPESCEDISTRAVNIINICLSECAPLNARLSDGYSPAPVIGSLADEIEYDTSLLLSVIPFGIAAYISTDEDPVMYSNMTDKYHIAYRNAMRYSRGQIRPITEVY